MFGKRNNKLRILFYVCMVGSIISHIVFWTLLGTNGYTIDGQTQDIDGNIPGRIPEFDQDCGGKGQFACQQITGALIAALVLSVISGVALISTLIVHTLADYNKWDVQLDGCSPNDDCGQAWLYIYLHWIGVVCLAGASFAAIFGAASVDNWSKNVCLEELPPNTLPGHQPYLCDSIANYSAHYDISSTYKTIFKFANVSMFEVEHIGTQAATVQNGLYDAFNAVLVAFLSTLVGTFHMCR